MAHTPGPWIWVGDELYAQDAYRAHCASVETLQDPPDWDNYIGRPEPIVETDSAYYGPRGDDRLLIAAAPDLFSACRAFVVAWEKSLQLEKTDVALRAAKAAIAKAEGR
jgi:hypothetical protein